MNILFLTHRVPFPPNKGDRIRSFNIIKYLSKFHSISLMSIAHEPVDSDTYKVLSQYCESINIFPLNLKFAKLKACIHLLSKTPLTLPIFYSWEFRKALNNKLLKQKLDLIFVYSSSMAQYVIDSVDIPILMDFIDVDSQKWLDLSERASLLKKAIYRREGKRLRTFERRVAKCSAHNIVASKRELKLLENVAAGLPASAILNGVDLPSESNGHGRNNNLVFIGAMDYPPNIDAMIYFSSDIFPRIQSRVPDVTLSIVGHNPPRRIKHLGKVKGITVTGSVRDIEPFLSIATASVVPLRVARGIQNKILEAMAHGVPVITTSCGLDGIEAVPGKDVLTADYPYDFAEKTVEILKDRTLRQRLSEGSLELVKRKYAWRNNLKQLDYIISNIST